MSMKWRTMVGVSLGAALPPLAVSSVSIALPAIGSALHQDLTAIEWVVIAYQLTITSLLLTFGRLGDLISMKRLYVIGLAVATLGALVCGLASTFPWLLGGRVVQGLGGAMMFSVSAAIVTRAFPPSERGLALGVNAVFIYAGLAVGPLLGALLLNAFGWQAVFLVNVPAGLIGVALAVLLLPEPPVPGRARFDFLGAFAGSAALLALLLALTQGPRLGYSPTLLGLLGVAVAAGALFLRVERQAEAPVLDLTLFRNRLFSAALLSGVLAYVVLFLMNLLIPFWLIHGLGYAYLHAALLLTPVPIAMFVFGPVSGWLSDRIGSRSLTCTGMLCLSLSFLWLSHLGFRPGYAVLLPPLVLNGIGMGVFASPNNSAIMGGAPAGRLGTAAGVLATSRNLGMAIGTATGAAVTAVRLPVHLGAHLPATLATIAAYQDAFAVAAGLAVLGAATSLVRGSAPTGRVRQGQVAAF